MTNEISIYATKVITEGEQITLSGFDTSQLVQEFNAEELLECMELSDIADYLTKKTEEALEDEISDKVVDEAFGVSGWREDLDKLTIRRVQ